jgi:serine/threonine-protein kinase
MSEGLDRIKPGDRVGPYNVVRAFKGRGGMARIFEVEVREKYRRAGLPRRLALKIAKPEHQSALTAEADFLSRFDHPNVVRIFPLPGYHRPIYAAREQFSFGWGWYYAMEVLGGGSLERRLTRPTTVTEILRPPSEDVCRLPLLEALGIARQLALALEHIHERFVVNLDVKPGNVLFRRRRLKYLRRSVPQAVLCDFGISRDSRYVPRTDLLGMVTPEYMSPEQAREKGRQRVKVDGRSDVFSLGIVVYEMLTGKLPFEDLGEMIDPDYVPVSPRQLRPSIPQVFEDVVMRMLAKDADHRFRAASDVRVALERVPTPFDWAAATRRAVAVGAVGVTLSACLGVGGLGVMIAREVLSTDPTPVPTSPPATEAASASSARAQNETTAPTVDTVSKTSTPASMGDLVDTPVPSGSSFKEDS